MFTSTRFSKECTETAAEIAKIRNDNGQRYFGVPHHNDPVR